MLDQLNNDLKRLLKLTSEIATINQMLVYHSEASNKECFNIDKCNALQAKKIQLQADYNFVYKKWFGSTYECMDIKTRQGAKLKDLLSDNEFSNLSPTMRYFADSGILVKELTLLQLNSIAFVLMETENIENIDQSLPLANEAINILTKRAVEKDISIF